MDWRVPGARSRKDGAGRRCLFLHVRPGSADARGGCIEGSRRRRHCDRHVHAGGDNVLGAFAFTNASSFYTVNVGASRIPTGGIGDSVNLAGTTTSPFGDGTADFAATGSVKGVKNLDTAFEISSDFTIAFDIA